MSKRFTSYKDLLEEKQQLEVLLQAQKQVIRYDVEEIKLKLQPVKEALEFIRKITTKDRTSLLLDLGSDIAINTVDKKFYFVQGWMVNKDDSSFLFKKLFFSFHRRAKRQVV